MALPVSRDYDAVDAGPLPHTTVNAIQDGIVDHETRILQAEADILQEVADREGLIFNLQEQVVPLPWRDDNFDQDYVISNDGDSLRLPVGWLIENMRIRECLAWIDVDTLNGELDISLKSKNGLTGAVTTIDTHNSGALAVGVHPVGGGLFDHTVNIINTYWIELETTGPGNVTIRNVVASTQKDVA